MDSGQVKTFCDAAAHLLPQLGQYVSADAEKRKPEDLSLIRQLQVAASALNNALIETARMIPPPMPPMPPQAPAPTASDNHRETRHGDQPNQDQRR